MIVSGILRTRHKTVGNLWTTNAAYARQIFRTILANDWFFQILGAIYFDDKTTSNQQRWTK